MVLACAVVLVNLVSGSMSDLSFVGQTLADHSYVDLSTVGSASDDSDSVVCHTDLSTCCSGPQGSHRGDWYFPISIGARLVVVSLLVWLVELSDRVGLACGAKKFSMVCCSLVAGVVSGLCLLIYSSAGESVAELELVSYDVFALSAFQY